MIKKILALFKKKPAIKKQQEERPSTALPAQHGSYKLPVRGFHGGARNPDHGHFARVSGFSNLFRSGQPLYDEECLKVLSGNNISLIVNLRHESSIGGNPASITLYREPMDTKVNNNPAVNNPQTVHYSLFRVKEYILRNPDKGVLIHCLHGEDRTGIFIRLLKEMIGVSEENTIKEFRSFGGTPYPALINLYHEVKKL